MKKVILVFALGIVLSAAGFAYLSGGLSRTVSVKILWKGVEIAACPVAEAAELGEGGFELNCSSPHAWSLRVLYSSRQRHDGTIKSLVFQRPEDWLPVDLRLGAMVVDGNGCTTAAAPGPPTGVRPIPLSALGAPLPGTYPIELSKPCGKLVLELARP